MASCTSRSTQRKTISREVTLALGLPGYRHSILINAITPVHQRETVRAPACRNYHIDLEGTGSYAADPWPTRKTRSMHGLCRCNFSLASSIQPTRFFLNGWRRNGRCQHATLDQVAAGFEYALDRWRARRCWAAEKIRLGPSTRNVERCLLLRRRQEASNSTAWRSKSFKSIATSVGRAGSG